MTPSYKILLVDDHPMNRDLTSRILHKRGHQVDVAENGLLAFEKFQQTSYDIILMDLQMPVMDGLEATRKIRQYEQAQNSEGAVRARVPIVAMTASDDDQERSASKNAGMDGFISKPIDIKSIGSTLQQIIESSRPSADPPA